MYAHLADSPTNQEIDSGVSKMGMKKSGADAKIPAEFNKALARDEEASKCYWCRRRDFPFAVASRLPVRPDH